MKVIVLMSTPENLTLDDVHDTWHDLDNLNHDLQIKYVLLDKQATYEDRLKAIDNDAEAVLGLFIRDNVITRKFLDEHPKLKYLSTLAHGFGKFDYDATKERNVTLTNTIYGDSTIAEYGFALLLDICHDIEIHSNYIKNEYLTDTSSDKKYTKIFSRQIELYGKTMGIWGLGNIGYCTAKIAHGFGMNVVSYSRHKKSGSKYDFIEQVSLDELLQRSDVISLNTPLTEHTENMVNKEVIAKMKDGVILINTARGKLIIEEDLVEALNSGKIYAAGLDVLRDEPLLERVPILDCPNAKITGHIAWCTRESRFRAIKMAIDNFNSYLNGNPVSVIND